MVFTTCMGKCMGDVRDGRAPLSARRSRARMVAVAALAAVAVWLVAVASASAFSAQGSVEQVYVTGLAPSAQMSLLRSNGETVSTQTADSLGGLLFRNVAPGRRYRVRLSSTGEESGPITVHTQAAAPWDPSIYKQSIPDSGYTYLTTRDGTQLAIDVHPPGLPAGVFGSDAGFQLPASSTASGTTRYPTLIEYSGYGYANPAGPESGIAEVANLMGFAVVDVNMRGTGCSGGAFDYFEPLENLDAYDVIETIAHQPWVLHHKVGMLGISYGGISQLFAAQLDPPDLEAIAPLSVLDATATTLYPGGILNTGFAVPWAEERQHDAEPAGPGSGEHWAYEQIQNGDQTCAANQDLHGEATNLLAEIKAKRDLQPVCGRPAGPGDVRPQHRCSDVHGMPVGGRADGRALRRSGASTSPAPNASGSRSPTAPTSTRSIRIRSTGCTTSWSCSSRTERRSIRPDDRARRGSDHLPDGDGGPDRGRTSRCRRTRSRNS